MNDQPTPSAPARKVRSPGYPGIDLDLALQRAKALWEQEHHYKTSIPTILGHWGYGAKSGGGFAAIAALKAFGLLQDEGSGDQRQAWLTKRAQDILTTEDPAERQRLIQEVAVLPRAHRDVWEKYGARLPSDQSLKVFLMQERGFTPSGAAELVSEWKRTMKFAQLADSSATVPPHGDPYDEDKPDESSDSNGGSGVTPPATIQEPPPAPIQPPAGRAPAATVGDRQQRTVQVPHSPDPGDWAMVQARFPMSEQEWDSMISVLESMKIGLVKQPDEG